MSHKTNLIKSFLKNKIFYVFQYQGIDLFLFVHTDSTPYASITGVFMMKQNILKEFHIKPSCFCCPERSKIGNSYTVIKYNEIIINDTKLYIKDETTNKDISNVCLPSCECIFRHSNIRINNISISFNKYDNCLIDGKLFVKEKINNKSLEYLFLYSKNNETIINSIKDIDFLKSLYLLDSIFQYQDIFVIVYYDENDIFRYRSMSTSRIKIYENNIKIYDEIIEYFLMDSYHWTIPINDYDLCLTNKNINTECFYNKKIVEEIEYNENLIDMLPEIIKDEIKFINENISKETKKISEWINYFKIINFSSFLHGDFYFNYIK